MLLFISLALLAAEPSQHRVDRAREHRSSELRKLFHSAGVPSPDEIYLRAFKEEGELELWAGAAGRRMVRVHTFKICAASGVLGPKRRRGDLQVPEGLYTIDRFNPVSSFHLSLGLDYPNDDDRAREGKADLGGDIFIHGGCATVGCLPMTDAGIELLYLAALDARRRGQEAIPVDVFPLRMDAAGRARLAAIAAGDAALLNFWEGLGKAFDIFERTGRPPPRPRIRASL